MRKEPFEIQESFVRYKALLKCFQEPTGVYLRHLPRETGNCELFSVLAFSSFEQRGLSPGSHNYPSSCDARRADGVVSMAAVTRKAVPLDPPAVGRGRSRLLQPCVASCSSGYGDGGAAGPSACPASDSPFLGPCSWAWGQKPTAPAPFSSVYPGAFLQLLSLSDLSKRSHLPISAWSPGL